jgi:ribosomal protein L11 methyltransferase
VIAIDKDRESVAATRANAAANDVLLDVRKLDLRHEPLPAAPIVVANLLAPLLLELAARIETAPRALIAGGLLIEQADAVAAEFAARHGLAQRERREAGEWAALLLSCPS